MPCKIGDNAAISATLPPKEEALSKGLNPPCATIMQLTQVEHTGAAV